MSIGNLIKGALLNLKANKVRVFLTMIGIIIGISSVVVVLSIGDGLKAEVVNSTGNAKVNKIEVSFQPTNYNEDILSLEPFTEDDIYTLAEIDGVEKVEKSKGNDIFASLGDSISGEVKFLDKSTSIYASPYNPSKQGNTLFTAPISDASKILSGRYFQEGDIENDVIVITYDTAKKLFDEPEDAVGKAVNINSTMFEIIGVLEKIDGLFTTSTDLVQQSSIDRINSVNKKVENQTISSVDVHILPGNDFEIVINTVKERLEEAHPEINGTYEAFNPGEITKAFTKIISGITAFIALITAISLLVGGIGVMNIMYVSVTERKREIGIRRAIGATPRSIMLQFLFEAMFVTLLGGLIGILLGFLLSKIAGVFMPFKPILTMKSFIGSSATSIIVGIVFGIIPAYKASKLDPIKAIYN